MNVPEVRKTVLNQLKTFKKSKLDFWGLLILLVYGFLLAILIRSHEPWFDESQAWLLARDLNPIELVMKYLRYESSPGLWHLILMIPSKLGLPFGSLNIVAGIIAFFGVYVFIRYSPFPVIIKVLFPFSFFIFYQYATIARGYVLAPLLLFLIAVKYQEKMESSFVYTSLLTLLSLISLHGTAISLAIFAVHIRDLLQKWTQLSHKVRCKQIIASSCFILVVVLIALIIWPPKDIILGGLPIHSFFVMNWLGLPGKIFLTLSDAFVTSFDVELNRNYLNLFLLVLFILLFYLSLRFFWRTKTLLLYSLPTLALVPIFALNYSAPWHKGIFFLVWVFTFWVGLLKRKKTRDVKNLFLLTRLLFFLTCLILCIQIYWSYNSFKYDYFSNYSGSREMARYIVANSLFEKDIFIKRKGNIELLPYFKKNIFTNYHHKGLPSFWFWSKNGWLDDGFQNLQAIKPDYIFVHLNRSIANSELCSFKHYQLLKVFRGGLYWKTKIHRYTAILLYQKRKNIRFPIPNDEALRMIQTWHE